MKFKVNKFSFAKALYNVHAIVEKKHDVSVISNVKIDVVDNKVILTTTDMDMSASSTIDALVSQEGSLILSSQLLYDIVKKIPERDSDIFIEFEQRNSSLELSYLNKKILFSIPCSSSDNFPILSEGELTSCFEIDSKSLSQMIDMVKFIILDDKTIYYSSGMFLHKVENLSKNDELRAVATDGHRLVYYYTDFYSSKNFNGSILIPKKTVNEIRKIMHGSEKVLVEFSDAKIKVTSGKEVVISKLIDGKFPEYQKVIPNNDKILKINRRDLYSAIDRISTVSGDKYKSVTISIKNDKLFIKSEGNGSLAVEEIANIETNFSGEINSQFNSNYLLEIIHQINNDVITIKFDEKVKLSSILIDRDTINGCYVLMPLNL